MEPEVVGKRIMKLMEEQNVEIEALASKMKLDVKILKDKLEGKEEFYLNEMIEIKNIFKLDAKSCDELFFKK